MTRMEKCDRPFSQQPMPLSNSETCCYAHLLLFRVITWYSGQFLIFKSAFQMRNPPSYFSFMKCFKCCFSHVRRLNEQKYKSFAYSKLFFRSCNFYVHQFIPSSCCKFNDQQCTLGKIFENSG